MNLRGEHLSRKDYINIANVLSETLTRDGDGLPAEFLRGWEGARGTIASALAMILSENPRFDRDRFLIACKVTR
jgi:hypothetical protein